MHVLALTRVCSERRASVLRISSAVFAMATPPEQPSEALVFSLPSLLCCSIVYCAIVHYIRSRRCEQMQYYTLPDSSDCLRRDRMIQPCPCTVAM